MKIVRFASVTILNLLHDRCVLYYAWIGYGQEVINLLPINMEQRYPLALIIHLLAGHAVKQSSMMIDFSEL